jgi:hypothetical protein
MITIFKDTKVFVACPAKISTGGPELLHQLVFNLRKELNIDAYMYYFPSGIREPVHESYKKYNNPDVESIKDEAWNILIVPEIYKAIIILGSCQKIRKLIWWLSIDFFGHSRYLYRYEDKPYFFILRAYHKLLRLFNLNTFNIYITDHLLKDPYIEQASYHLAQSFYSQKELLRQGLPEEKILYLSDYINDIFLIQEFDINKKENIVAYNPQKGYEFTRKIIGYDKNLSFIPIINLTREEVINLLKRAKVYIDFGNHPGKDRFPREAAILGCCVITGKRGAARYCEDVSIPDEYKFEDTFKNIPLIVGRIKECLTMYQEKEKDFNQYREMIRDEKSKFIADLKSIFIKQPNDAVV